MAAPQTAAAAASATHTPRNRRVSTRSDERDASRPSATRRPEETLAVAGDVTDVDLAAEIRHLHNCPTGDALVAGASIGDEGTRVEFYDSDGTKRYGDTRVPVVYRMARCIDCGEQVRSEPDRPY
jgi:hypothetical protein